MVGMKNQQHVEGFEQDRRCGVVLGRHGVHHMEEITRITQVVAGVDVGLADRLLVGEGGDGLQLGDEPDDVQVEVGLCAGVGIVGCQRGHHC